MNKKLLKKFRRYLELSIKFEKTPTSLFERIPMKSSEEQGGSITVDLSSFGGSGSYIYTDANKESKRETRADMIMNAAKENAKLSNDYDEYKQLQRDLTEFLNAENKL